MRRVLIPGLIAIVFISACTTTGGGGTAAPAPGKMVGAGDDPLRPVWTREFPQDDSYYIGIGASNTGNDAEDRKIAEERARSAIAAAISTKIHEEVNIVSRESTTGGTAFNYAEDRVSAEVEQSLTGVETVDTYSSKASGTWVYMRLSRELWERTQKEEMAALIKRITDFLAPVLDDYNRPLVTRIQQLVKARDLILESPYPGMLETVFYGEKGSLIDIVESFLKEHLDSLYTKVKPVSAELAVGTNLEFSVEMSSSVSARIGNLPLEVVDKTTGKQILTAVTDPEGTYSGEIKYTSLAMGKNQLIVRPDKEALKLSADVPEKEIIVDLQGITMGLKVLLPEDMNVPGVSGAVLSLFSRKDLPFKVDSRGGRDPYIEVEFVITDFPKVLEGAPDMAQVSAVITLVKKGKSMYSFESSPVKDGGLTPDQAHKRAVDKLMKELSSNNEFVEGILSALSLN